ncbi:MAG TPA: cytochrome c3 family protein [Paludibacter sp.]|nr:cytochrome c3 family protein [Paludibacter sp.]
MKSLSPARTLFILLTLFLWNIDASSQRTPGDLSQAHASLDGIGNCKKCHETTNNKATSNQCLACHVEIKANMNARKGLHGSPEALSKSCVACHSEHHGRNFSIKRIDKRNFDHRRTGFALEGEHAKQACTACHNSKRISNPKFKNKPGTFMGLSKECLNCHTDFHQGKLSTKCNDCHGFDTFKKSIGFDHSTTRFPLLGQHKKVDCLKCHKTEIINGKVVQRFKGLAFSNCTACHQDVHKNKFGQDCKKCHTELSFHFNKSMKAFNHDKTAFKLIGQHKFVDCKECHKTSMTAPIKHDRCIDCHKDFHKGEFVRNGMNQDCSQCHTNQGFSPSTFTIERHNQTRFKLEGAHMATQCSSCHKKQNGWTFRKMGNNCVDCHKNIHEGRMADKFMQGGKCTNCHNVSSWKSVTFDHNQTRFKLDGGHQKAACSACHFRRNEMGRRVQLFAGTAKDCISCHNEPHRGQFAVNGKTDCQKCHTTSDWHKTTFDHNTSRFKLDGGHKGLKCGECHKPATDAKGKYIQYKFEDISCSKCHG